MALPLNASVGAGGGGGGVRLWKFVGGGVNVGAWKGLCLFDMFSYKVIASVLTAATSELSADDDRSSYSALTAESTQERKLKKKTPHIYKALEDGQMQLHKNKDGVVDNTGTP